VIEAIVEELGAQQELFRELERVCRPDAVLATNRSALSVTEIAAVTSSRERVVGMHFFNPAPLSHGLSRCGTPGCSAARAAAASTRTSRENHLPMWPIVSRSR
jgi:3-hydroxybutyryl-CoA dehydrogenase